MRITAGEDIKGGDLVTMGADGKLRAMPKAEPSDDIPTDDQLYHRTLTGTEDWSKPAPTPLADLRRIAAALRGEG